MYRTDFWTLWEKARVGCFERTACILSIVKQITSPGGMHETSSRAWCTGKTQRNRVEKEVGGGIAMGIHVTPWLIHVTVWQNPLQCCEVISLQLIKINGKKKRMLPLLTVLFRFFNCQIQWGNFILNFTLPAYDGWPCSNSCLLKTFSCLRLPGFEYYCVTSAF